MRSFRAFTTCTSQAVPCKIRLPHLDSPTDRHAIDQQIHLYGMHPSSINNRPSISPSPPQSNTPQQPTHRPGLHRTRTPCRRSSHQPHSPAHLQSTYPPSINHTKRHIQTTRPPINDATPHTITPDPLRPCPAPLKDATSVLLPPPLPSRRSHPRRLS